jgi:hypothetical protein
MTAETKFKERFPYRPTLYFVETRRPPQRFHFGEIDTLPASPLFDKVEVPFCVAQEIYRLGYEDCKAEILEKLK